MMDGSFPLSIAGNKVGCPYITQKQLLCPDSSKPNVVEANSEEVLDDCGEKTIYTTYIKITLDNAANPTTATVEYHFKLYSSGYSGVPGMSDTVVAKYEGTLSKVTSGS